MSTGTLTWSMAMARGFVRIACEGVPAVTLRMSLPMMSGAAGKGGGGDGTFAIWILGMISELLLLQRPAVPVDCVSPLP